MNLSTPTKSLSTFLVLALLLASASVIFTGCDGNFFPVWKIGQSKFLLIRDADFGSAGADGGRGRRNRALLITDEKQIKEHEQLFLGNSRLNPACSYHYQIQFWSGGGDLIGDFPFSKECEELLYNEAVILTKMRAHIQQIETQTPHNIYNLKIPVTVDPETLKNFLAGSSLPVFFFGGKTEHFSSLTFSYEQVSPIKQRGDDHRKWRGDEEANRKLAIDKIRLIAEEIQKIILVKEKSKVETDVAWPQQGKIAHVFKLTLKFSNGADLTKVKELIIARGGKIEKEHHPTHWFVQLVDTSNKLDQVKAKLAQYKFVAEVYEYPNRE